MICAESFENSVTGDQSNDTKFNTHLSHWSIPLSFVLFDIVVLLGFPPGYLVFLQNIEILRGFATDVQYYEKTLHWVSPWCTQGKTTKYRVVPESNGSKICCLFISLRLLPYSSDKVQFIFEICYASITQSVLLLFFCFFTAATKYNYFSKSDTLHLSSL